MSTAIERSLGSTALIAFLAPSVLYGCGSRSGLADLADVPIVEADAGGEYGIDAGTFDAADTFDARGADVTPADGRPAEDAPMHAVDASQPCVPLEPCACDGDGACAGSCTRTACALTTGLACVCSAPSTICGDPANGTCDCGFAFTDHCLKPLSHCLCTSCADAPGSLCVTDSEQSQICSGPFRSAFACP
jgi:hypothetical protein